MSSNVPNVATAWRVTTYGRHDTSGWMTIREQTGPIRLLLQPEMGHVLVIHNATVLESLPLLLDPETVQVHVNGDVLMFVITHKTKKSERRFRLRLAREETEENAREPSCDCVEALRKYFAIHGTSNEASSDSIEETKLAEAFERILTPSRENRNASSLHHIFHESSSASAAEPRLDNLVRLCLLDPTFPSLVGAVQKSFKSLTAPEELS